MAEHDAPPRHGQAVRVAVTDDSLTAGRLWQLLADAGIRSLIRTHDVLPEPGSTRAFHYQYDVFVAEQDVPRALPLLGDEVRVPGLADEQTAPALAEREPMAVENSVRPGARAAALVLPVLLVMSIVAVSMIGRQEQNQYRAAMMASASPSTAAVALAPPTRHPTIAGTPQATAPTTAVGSEGSAPELSGTPRAARGSAVQPADSTFVVNTAPVGCHQEPRATADMVMQFPPGAVQAMNATATQPDGVWQRQADRGCWTRITGAPVSVFANVDSAECFAVAFRRPPPLVAHCVTITAVNGAPAGGIASLLAQTPPGSVCTGNALSVQAGSFRVQEFGSRPADANGWVYWSWEVHPDTPPGPSAITITCLPGGSATATVLVG